MDYISIKLLIFFTLKSSEETYNCSKKGLSLLIKQTDLKAFIGKLLPHVTSAHISLVKTSHMAAPNFQWAHESYPVSGRALVPPRKMLPAPTLGTNFCINQALNCKLQMTSLLI